MNQASLLGILALWEVRLAEELDRVSNIDPVHLTF